MPEFEGDASQSQRTPSPTPSGQGDDSKEQGMGSGEGGEGEGGGVRKGGREREREGGREIGKEGGREGEREESHSWHFLFLMGESTAVTSYECDYRSINHTPGGGGGYSAVVALWEGSVSVGVNGWCVGFLLR